MTHIEAAESSKLSQKLPKARSLLPSAVLFSYLVIVGPIASTAMRLMGSVTKQLTKVFFICVKQKIETEIWLRLG
jgi:hypothetical protein